MKEYAIELDTNGREISRDNTIGKNMYFIEGLCKGDLNNPSSLEHRTIKWYDENVLSKIYDPNAKFDDRKLRIDSATFIGDGILFRMGHSHFKEYKEPIDDPSKAEEWVKMGNVYFNDPCAFLPRAPGATGVVLTSDKHLIIGQREVGDGSMYEGCLQVTGGHIDFRENLYNLNVEGDVTREAGEMRVKPENIESLVFLGLFSNTKIGGSDVDFSYLIKTDIHSEFYTSGEWREVDDNEELEHSKNILDIPNYDSLQELLITNEFEGKETKDFIFSTRGILENIREGDLK